MVKDKKENKILTSNKEEFDIPVEGSIGLLALGDVGLRAWRKVRKEAKIKLMKDKKVQKDAKK